MGLLKKLEKSCFTTLRKGLATNVVRITFKFKLFSSSTCIVRMFFLACPQHNEGFVCFTQSGSKLSSGTTSVVCHICITLPLINFQLLFTELFFTLMCMLLFVICTSVSLQGFLMPFGMKVKGWVQIRIA